MPIVRELPSEDDLIAVLLGPKPQPERNSAYYEALADKVLNEVASDSPSEQAT